MLTEKEIDLFESYIENPPHYLREALGVEEIEFYQENILQAFVDYDRIAIRAPHSVGKTWLFARAALWFFYLFRDSIVITTAPTYRQVKSLLWGEIREAFKSAPIKLGGELLSTELRLSDKHYMIGFSPKTSAGTGGKEQQGSSFQGFHSENILILFDEATGISPDVWTMAEGLMTSGKTVKFVAIANPTTRNCAFFSCFGDPAWHNIQISCFDSPNLIQNGITNKQELREEIDHLSVLNDSERIHRIQGYKKPVPHLLTAQFVLPYVMKHGFEHPLVLSKVFGEFPLNDDEVLVQYEDVFAAQQRDLKLDQSSIRYLGVDVARGGGDKSVITDIEGWKQVSVDIHNKRDLMFISGLVLQKINEQPLRVTVLTIDATGLGSGVLDRLLEEQRAGNIGMNITIVELHFGSTVMNIGSDKPNASKALKEQEKSDRKRYSKVKAKMFDRLALDLKNNLDLLPESIYLEELPTIKYAIDGQGRIVIESKKDYKSRTRKSSPDSSDSLAIANFGRYVTIRAGTFNNKEKQEPLVKQAKRKERKLKIKGREY